MKKMSTLFKKDPNNLALVIDGEYNEENLWVFERGVLATRKFDGTACAIIEGELYKRYDAKKNRTAPEGAIPCCEKDKITGHHPHWVKCNRGNPSDKYHWEAMLYHESMGEFLEDGTYELIGVKVQNNAENLSRGHMMIKHGREQYDTNEVLADIKGFLKHRNIEGIVFHHPDGRMCKIRKKDFGDKR